MNRTLLVAVLALGWVGVAFAAVEDCPDPESADLLVPGAAPMNPSAKCEGVNYTDSLDPPDVPRTQIVVSRTDVDGDVTPTEAVEAPEPAQPEDTETDYNNRQMMRLGELDALQGKPLNMSHANDLGYMQGYTRGQSKRMAPNTGLAPAGFGGFHP